MKVISLYLSTVFICIVIVIVALFIFTPEPCEHEETMSIYSFQFENSTASHYTRQKCKYCDQLLPHTNFRGTPTNTPYLELLKEHSDGDEIVPGEYYTVTATVTLVTLNSYDEGRFWTVRVGCKLRNEDMLLGFSVDFRKEFWDQVALLEKGDEITFRGKFYDEGCGFTDSELLIIKNGDNE